MKSKMKLLGTDYRTLFTLGIIFTGAGVAIGLPPMMMLGLIFLIVGLVNRAKLPVSANEEI